MPRFRLFHLAFLLLAWFATPFPLPGQTAPLASAVRVTLGHSVVALTGPWKFHIGDNPRWANPNFDDSAWETVDLNSKKGSIDPSLGVEGYVPGWTAKGHPGYAGFAWYRMRIHITGADGRLALLSPTDFDDSYQLFINGRLIASYGDFDRPVPTVYYSNPVMFALPAGDMRHSPDRTMVVAFRFYMAPGTLLHPQSGGLHSPPILGLVSAVTAAYHVAWEEEYRVASSTLAAGILYLVFALLILMLYAFDRTETVLLWPLGACAVLAMVNMVVFFVGNTQAMTAQQLGIFHSVTVSIAFGLWMMTWWAYFGLQDRKWIRNTIGVLVLWYIASFLLFDILLYRGSVSHRAFAAHAVIGLASDAVFSLLLILIAYFGWRRPQRAGWALFLALFFYIIPGFQPILGRLHVRTMWFPFGVGFNLGLACSFGMLLFFSLVLLGRFRSSQRRQQAMLQDVKQAQEVQQVLIPEDLPRIPGLTIESEYRPAREVGGDFFQIIPHPTDGSVLIVAGDVTGHGLQAGMLVALIVGAIRSTAETSADPLVILEALNRRLCGRGEAHATCLALRIAADGAARLANAGHLPPYLNGKELPMEGALPLGMVSTAEFPVLHFHLNENDRLLLMSDGVAEAQDEHGHLFGFERIRDLVQRQITATELATAAQNFGQQDDISVLRIVRQAVIAGQATAEPALALG